MQTVFFILLPAPTKIILLEGDPGGAPLCGAVSLPLATIGVAFAGMAIKMVQDGARRRVMFRLALEHAIGQIDSRVVGLRRASRQHHIALAQVPYPLETGLGQVLQVEFSTPAPAIWNPQ